MASCRRLDGLNCPFSFLSMRIAQNRSASEEKEMGRIKLAMAWATAGLLAFLIGETLNKSSAAGEQIFCPHAAVFKVGNTQSIPPL